MIAYLVKQSWPFQGDGELMWQWQKILSWEDGRIVVVVVIVDPFRLTCPSLPLEATGTSPEVPEPKLCDGV